MGHGEKPWVVVSNNVRNRNLNTVLAARVTTTPKPGVPTAVPLGAVDPLVGSILADDLIQLFDDEIAASRPSGSLSPATMIKLNKALAIALGLPDEIAERLWPRPFRSRDTVVRGHGASDQ